MLTAMGLVKDNLRQLMNWPEGSAVQRLARNAYLALEEEDWAKAEAVDHDRSIAWDVYRELCRAKKVHPTPFASEHDGYAVILEELDELWAEVKKRRALHDPDKMREECIQIAAMAARFVSDLIDAKKVLP